MSSTPVPASSEPPRNLATPVPVASGERSTRTGPESVHDRKTEPPPMTPAEYREGFVLTLRLEKPTVRMEALRPETSPPNAVTMGTSPPNLGSEEPVHATAPPAARSSESLAKMYPPAPFTMGETPRPPPPALRTPPPISGGPPSWDPLTMAATTPYPAPTYDTFAVPPPPLVPLLSIPVPARPSDPERLAVSTTSSPPTPFSTDRPTALALDAELADRTQVVRHAMPKAQIAALSLDHRAGFLISRIDGRLSLEELLDVSGMPEDDALAILADLLRRRVIALEQGARRAGRRRR